MITYADVKSSPHGWMDAMPNANEPTPNFELALAELIDGYRGKISREELFDALQAQRDRNEDWPDVAGETDPTQAEAEKETGNGEN
jgi:hypothetical protein